MVLAGCGIWVGTVSITERQNCKEGGDNTGFVPL
jgi:hypothetical protein